MTMTRAEAKALGRELAAGKSTVSKPTSKSLKSDIIKYLKSQDIDHDAKAKKTDLLKLVQ